MRLLIQNCTVVDGTGGPARRASVLVEGRRITAIGDIEAAPGMELVDGAGLTAAPGFVDLHSHSDLQSTAGAREKIEQGVTTELTGNCGFSAFPCGDHAGELREFAGGIFRDRGDWQFGGCGEFLRATAASPTAVHSLVGHGSLRVAVAGFAQGTIGRGQVDRMAGLLRESLEQGAAGMSTGLMYAPGSTAPAEEIEELCAIVARTGQLYATHMRSYSWDLVEAVDEQIGLAERSGCRLQISHLQAVGAANWDQQRVALDRIEEARARGVDVEFDIYPYTAGSTVLTQLLPDWALDGGTEAMLARLRDPSERARIAEGTSSRLATRWRDVRITGGGADVVGRNLEEIGEAWGMAPVDAALALLEREPGRVNIVSFNQSEENLRELLRHPCCTVISDGFYVDGLPHPRLFATFPRLLGDVVREWGWMGLEEAVHKVTGKPAARLGLAGRGLLREGFAADVVLFDRAEVGSGASYEDPEEAPRGIALVLRDGEIMTGGAGFESMAH